MPAAAPSPAAERMRRYRERQRAGRRVVQVEIDADGEEALIGAGLLGAWATDDGGAVADAVAALLRQLVRGESL